MYYLLCQRPYDNLPRHLKVACMKNNMEVERNAEPERTRSPKESGPMLVEGGTTMSSHPCLKDEDSCNDLAQKQDLGTRFGLDSDFTSLTCNDLTWVKISAV